MNRKEYLAARKTLMETVFWALLVSLAMVIASVVFEVSFVFYGAAQAVVLLVILVEIKRLINAREREDHFEEKPLGKEFDGDTDSTKGEEGNWFRSTDGKCIDDETLEEALARVKLPHSDLLANLEDDGFSKSVAAFNVSYCTALQEISSLMKELADLSYEDTRVGEIKIRLRAIEAENNHGFRDAIKESSNKLSRTTKLLHELVALKSDDPRVLEVKSEILRDIQLAMGGPGWEFLVEMSKYLNTDLKNTISTAFDPNSYLPELLEGAASMMQAEKILAEEPAPVDEFEEPLLSDELTPEAVAFGDTIKMFLEDSMGGATVTIWEDPMKLKYKARFGKHYFEADCMDDLMHEAILTLGYYTLEGVEIQ